MKRILWLVLGAALVATACADPAAPTTPTPAAPTITDTFSDTLLVAGANTHSFTVNALGGVRVTLTSVEPAVQVGLGIGTPSLGSCSLIQRVDATQGNVAQLSGTATVPGLYCILIFDIVGTDGLGTLTAPAVYTINVLHS